MASHLFAKVDDKKLHFRALKWVDNFETGRRTSTSRIIKNSNNIKKRTKTKRKESTQQQQQHINLKQQRTTGCQATASAKVNKAQGGRTMCTHTHTRTCDGPRTEVKKCAQKQAKKRYVFIYIKIV